MFHPIRLIESIKQIKRDWECTLVENAQFFKDHKAELQNIRLGCSLSPEHLESLKIHNSPEQVLDYLKELGIKEIRLGIRWNRSVDENGKVDLSYYSPWIKQSLKRGMKLCLNVGPIKVFRWPEDHVPKSVLKKLAQQGSLPEKGALIEPNDPLAVTALEYLNAMLPKLRKLTGNHSVTMQPENEAHVPFGEHEWVASNDYFLAVCKVIKKHFSRSNLLLNSPAVHQSRSPLKHSSTLQQTAQVAQRIADANPDWNIISGVDVYPDTPQSAKVPFSGGLRADTQMALIISCGSDVLDKYVTNMNACGVTTEITELQAEPWGNRTDPGNSAQSLRFAILRSLPFVNSTKPTTMRLWGIEHLYAQRVKGVETGEHKKMLELIRLINSQNS